MARRRQPRPPAALDRKPSGVTDASWLFAERKIGEYPAHTDRGGKWLIFVPATRIDAVWAKVKDATEKGLLGELAKVSTARPKPNDADPGTKVICVFTYDGADGADVRRIRAALRELGIVDRIPYKADEDTRAGRYARRGNPAAPAYFE